MDMLLFNILLANCCVLCSNSNSMLDANTTSLQNSNFNVCLQSSLTKVDFTQFNLSSTQFKFQMSLVMILGEIWIICNLPVICGKVSYYWQLWQLILYFTQPTTRYCKQKQNGSLTVTGQNGDKPKRRQSERRQSKTATTGLVKTATGKKVKTATKS